MDGIKLDRKVCGSYANRAIQVFGRVVQSYGYKSHDAIRKKPFCKHWKWGGTSQPETIPVDGWRTPIHLENDMLRSINTGKPTQTANNPPVNSQPQRSTRASQISFVNYSGESSFKGSGITRSQDLCRCLIWRPNSNYRKVLEHLHYDSRRKHSGLVDTKATHNSFISNGSRVHSLLQGSIRCGSHETAALGAQYSSDPATTLTNGFGRSNETIKNHKISPKIMAYRTPILLPMTRSQQWETTDSAHPRETKPSWCFNQDYFQSHDNHLETIVDGWNEREQDMTRWLELSE